MIITSFLLAAALQAAVAAGPRKEYVACLKTAESEALKRRLPVDQYGAFAHQNCAAIETQLRAGLTSFGIKNGLSKTAAADDAQMQIDDYVFSSEQRYADKLEHGG